MNRQLESGVEFLRRDRFRGSARESRAVANHAGGSHSERGEYRNDKTQLFTIRFA